MLTDFHVISPITNSFINILDVPNHEKTEFRCKVKSISRRKFRTFEKKNYFSNYLFLEIFFSKKIKNSFLVLYDTTTEKQVLPLQLEIEVLLEEYEVIDNHQGNRVYRTHAFVVHRSSYLGRRECPITDKSKIKWSMFIQIWAKAILLIQLFFHSITINRCMNVM